MEMPILRLARRFAAGVIATLFCFAAISASADTILFTASTDSSGMANPVSVPAVIPPGPLSPVIPSVDPGVTLNPNPAFLDGNITGPLNGVNYGTVGFPGSNTGGNTGWVHISDTVTTAGIYQLIWEVAGADPKIGSAVVFDNVRINGNLLFGFESGIPGGFTALGSVGTSGALPVTDASMNPLPPFNPTQGSSFAYMDISGGVTPIFDSNAASDGFLGSRLYSTVFDLSANDTLTLDMAFLTNDGDPFFDYGIAALSAVPEPSGLVLGSTAMLVLGIAALALPASRQKVHRAGPAFPSA
jgi:hypothetical protein